MRAAPATGASEHLRTGRMPVLPVEARSSGKDGPRDGGPSFLLPGAGGRWAVQPASCVLASGSDSLRNTAIRSASSISPMDAAARPSA